MPVNPPKVEDAQLHTQPQRKVEVYKYYEVDDSSKVEEHFNLTIQFANNNENGKHKLPFKNTVTLKFSGK